MNTRLRSSWFAGLLLLGLPLVVNAQNFDSGSTGAYGPINITASTRLTPPDDGVFHATTVTVQSGATLTFNRNANNTPITILATGDVNIAGSINLNATAPVDGNGSTIGGTGGAGGFDGGATGALGSGVSQPPGAGYGPGGGQVSGTDYVTRSAHYNYGNNLLLPLLGGSGGAAGPNSGEYGSGGGGAILIASNTRITVTGNIQANGGWAGTQGGGGSGGAIRLVSPRVYGTGSLTASAVTTGAQGRIRIDSLYKVEPLDPSQRLALSYNGKTSVGGNFILSTNHKVKILSVGGQAVVPDQPNSFLFPTTTSATNVPIVWEGSGYFKADTAYQIMVRVVPTSGPEIQRILVISYRGQNGPSDGKIGGTAPVTFPVNVVCDVQVIVTEITSS